MSAAIPLQETHQQMRYSERELSLHAVQNTIDLCINSATDRHGHLAHLYRTPNPYPNPSLVLGGVCRSATAALLMYVSLGAYTTVFCLS